MVMAAPDIPRSTDPLARAWCIATPASKGNHSPSKPLPFQNPLSAAAKAGREYKGFTLAALANLIFSAGQPSKNIPRDRRNAQKAIKQVRLIIFFVSMNLGRPLA